MSNVELSNKIVEQMNEIVKNMEFVKKNMEAFESRNSGTKIVDDAEMDMFKILSDLQKIKKTVDSQVNTVFLYTSRDKLQL